MNSFKLFLENKIASIEDSFPSIDEFYDFCDSLSMYIEVNDQDEKTALREYFVVLNNSGVLSKKTVYKLVKVKSKEDIKKIDSISSFSTSILKGSILEEMKETVNLYKSEGEFFYIELKNALGLDINNFYKTFFKGKKKHFIKYDRERGYGVMSKLYDTFNEKSKQKEFIVYGEYKQFKYIDI
jgi:hypothetical protein